MFIFILCFNLIIALNIFGAIQEGPITGTNPENYTYQTFDTPLSYTNIWSIGTGVAVAGAVLIAIATGSMIAVGIFLYGDIFWTGFLAMWSIFTPMINNNSTIMLFFGIGFAVMVIIFIAAIVGMLTGSG